MKVELAFKRGTCLYFDMRRVWIVLVPDVYVRCQVARGMVKVLVIGYLVLHWQTTADCYTPGHVDTHTHRTFRAIDGDSAGSGVDVDVVCTQPSTVLVLLM